MASRLQRRSAVTLPRPVYPLTASMVTRRCTQQQYLLRPDKETNNAVIYCLAVAAQRYDIDVMDFVQMSNHLHEGIFDRNGTAPAFFEHFHKLLAKCVNALRGRWRTSSRLRRPMWCTSLKEKTSSRSWSTSR